MTMTRKPYHKELALAVENGDSTGVGRWLARGASPDSVNDVGQPVLTLAAATGQTRSVMALLAAGAQVDIADGSCLTALHLAVVYGHLATAECLLAGGADLNAQIMSGRSPTPLHSAVIADSSAGGDTRVRFLLARGADIGCCAYVGLGAIGARGVRWRRRWPSPAARARISRSCCATGTACRMPARAFCARRPAKGRSSSYDSRGC